jgi:DNA-directed RNA polymerase subunit RPC12/RpoP
MIARWQETAALRNLDPAFVRFGSKADTSTCPRDVRFTPESGQTGEGSTCPLCANRVLMHRSKQQPYSITSGWWQAAFMGSSDRIDFACFEVDDELELGGLLNVLRFSAEKKKENQSQQKRNDQEASNLVCR